MNSIVYHSKFPYALVRLQLIESYCLSILTYAMDCLNTPKAKLLEIYSWWDTVNRKDVWVPKMGICERSDMSSRSSWFSAFVKLVAFVLLKNMSLSGNVVIAGIALCLVSASVRSNQIKSNLYRATVQSIQRVISKSTHEQTRNTDLQALSGTHSERAYVSQSLRCCCTTYIGTI